MAAKSLRRRAPQKHGLKVLGILMLAGAACLLLQASQAFVVGPQPSTNTMLTAGLRQADSAAAKPAATARPASTAYTTSAGAGTFALGLGGLALVAAAALRPMKVEKPKKSGNVVMAASTFQGDASSAPCGCCGACTCRSQVLQKSTETAAPSVCLMMSEMQLSQPVAEMAPAAIMVQDFLQASSQAYLGGCWAATSIAAEPVGQPRSFASGSSAGRRSGKARFVGGARRAFSKARSGSRGAFASRRAARRSCGAGLLSPAVQAPLAPSFDPSRLRLKIQTGLSTSSSVRSEHGRESRTPAANKGTCINNDARIQEKDLGEHLRRKTLTKSPPLLWAAGGRGSSTSHQ